MEIIDNKKFEGLKQLLEFKKKHKISRCTESILYNYQSNLSQNQICDMFFFASNKSKGYKTMIEICNDHGINYEELFSMGHQRHRYRLSINLDEIVKELHDENHNFWHGLLKRQHEIIDDILKKSELF